LESDFDVDLLFENNPHPMWAYDLETLAFLAVNEAAIDKYGYSRDEFLSMTIADIRPPEDVPALLENVAHVTEGLDHAGQWQHRRKDGSLIVVEITSHTLTFAGRPAELVMAHDITARTQAEESLQASEARFRLLAENARDLIYRYRFAPERGFEYVSPSATAITGYTPEEHYADPDLGFKLVHPDDRPLLESLAQSPPEAGTPLTLRWVRKDGSVLWTEQRNVPIYHDGQLVAVEGIARDITERTLAEAALHDSEERYRDLVENSQDLICTHDLQGFIRSANPAAARFLGYSLAELLRMNIRDVLAPEALAGFELYLRRMRKRGAASGEMVVLTKSGEKRVWEYNNSLRTEGVNEPIVRGMARDVTERKRAEAALAASEAELRALFAAMRDVVIVYDREGRYLNIAPTEASLLYKPSADLIGKTLHEVLPAAQADLLLQHLQRAIETRQTVTLDYSLSIGGRDFWFAGAISPLAGDRAMLVAHDITERKRAEAQAHLRAEQMAVASEIGRALAETIDLNEIYARFYRATLQLLPDSETLFISLFDPAQNVFRCVFALSEGELLDAAALPPVPLAPPGAGTQSETYYTRRPIIINDLPARTERMRVVVKIGEPEREAQSGLYVPMLAQDRFIGVLITQSLAPNRYTEADAALVSLVANTAAVAIENARLFDETRRRLAELEAVNRISTALRAAQSLDEMLPLLLDETLATLRAEAGSVVLYDPASAELRSVIRRGWFAAVDQTPLTPGEGIAGHVFTTGEAHVSREFASDPLTRAAIRPQIPPGWGGACIPLRTLHEVVGVLFISVPLPHELTEDEIRLLHTLAEIAGNAIHRTRLHEQTEKRLQQVQALRAIDMAITASFDVRVTLDVVLGQAITQMGVDAAAVLLLSPDTHLLEYAAGRGFRSNAMTRLRLTLGESYAGQAVRERRVVSVPNLAQATRILARPKLLTDEAFVAFFAAPLIAKGEVRGVLELFHRTPLQPNSEWLGFLETLAGQAAIAVDNTTLFNNLQSANAHLTLAYDATIEGWSRALDLRDKETEGHTRRVTEMSLRLAQAMGVGEPELVHIRRGALLHDIGKMGVPDSILHKPGPLTDEEWVIMRRHPQHAYDMLSSIAYLRPALDIPYGHHEKWDGTGYPRGLRGEQIPLAARIFAVVDVWDALRSHRPYRPGWPAERVREHIRSQAGAHFDPQVVDAFLRTVAQSTPDE
jgi:PAS domain S-box-containing protein